MKLKLVLPEVQPEVFSEPARCPQTGCGGTHFQLRQTCRKPVRDTVYHQVAVRRYGCLRCGHTFRVYPVGIGPDRLSLRLKAVAILLYLMGLSYGAVAAALVALGWAMSKSAVYYAVQAAGERVTGLRREAVQAAPGGPSPALGMDLTSVKCKGQWVTVGVGVDAVDGLTLTIDLLDNAESTTLTTWVQEVAGAVGATILVSDDADSFKIAADSAGLDHQVCKSHVRRNTEALVAALRPAVQQDRDGSLGAVGVTPAQAEADLNCLLALTLTRQPAAAPELEAMHRRYLAAQPPQHHDHASVAYRLRLLFLDRWNLWPRLTRYRTWHGATGQTLDGTNNASERTIGWDIKERYRTMRGYKRGQSILNVSRLLAYTSNHRSGNGAELVQLIA